LSVSRRAPLIDAEEALEDRSRKLVRHAVAPRSRTSMPAFGAGGGAADQHFRPRGA